LPSGDSGTKYLSALAPSLGVGKVNIGNKAIVKIDAYPYKEFGLIVSVVDKISDTRVVSDIQNQLQYELTVPLHDTLITDHNKTINYSPNMSATLEVITSDKSILSRIMEQFLDLIKDI